MNIFIDLLFANGHDDAPPLGGVMGSSFTRARRKKRGLLTSALCVCVCVCVCVVFPTKRPNIIR